MGDDVVSGRGGDDFIENSGGIDTLSGGAGRDEILSCMGSILGGPGADRLSGGFLGDGGFFPSGCHGGPGTAKLDGGTGPDLVSFQIQPPRRRLRHRRPRGR